MDFIKPVTITDSILISSNVPENDYQEWVLGTAYAVGDKVIVKTNDVHKIYECLVAQSAGLAADILDENCSDISDWDNSDHANGVSEVSPVGQFRFDGNIHATSNWAALERIILSPPDTFTVEIKAYFDKLGTLAANDYAYFTYSNTTWALWVRFCSDGLFISKASSVMTEVGSDIVKCNSSAAWQTWRFQVNKTVASTATVEVFLKEEGGVFVSQGTVDCDLEGSYGPLPMRYGQHGWTTDNILSHIDYMRIATGLGRIATVEETPVENSNWLEISATNRWKCFDSTIGSQSSQATPVQYVIAPGAVDSVALLNLESTSINITMMDGATERYNQTVTTGASKTDVAKLDLPIGYPSAQITITITNAGGTAKIGELIVGVKTFIGDLQYSPSIGIKDWSTKEVDVYGHYTITPRTYSKWLKASLTVLMTALDALVLNLAAYRSTPLVWVASETYSSLILYGYYTDFSIVLPYPAYCICSLEIESLT
jgi:hypothetical protein